MKKSFKKIAITVLILLAISTVVYVKIKPIRELKYFPPYAGTTNFKWQYPAYDSTKKTVIIMADNDMTETFDMLTPYYLFNETGEANVYIAAQKKYPIVTENGPFVLPHFTYTEVDSLRINPDVIVIPYMHSPESAEKTSWIQKRFNDSVLFLSICDGAWTAAASGVYDGVPLTSHATGHDKLKKKFTKPIWVQNTSVTESGNLYSTAGVSNATDGSLKVIQRLFGRETMLEVLKKIHYPHKEIRQDHISNALTGSAKLSVLKKVLFKENKTVGILLQNGMNEMDLAALFDINARTMPASILAVVTEGNSITTKHGLTIISTDKIKPGGVDELHVLKQDEVSEMPISEFKNADIIYYENQQGSYIIDVCLKGIKEEYGIGFSNFVKLTLDYN
ncbi:MAG TPA: DJ-1/PfpI family protein [Chitinophagaceae bacterium]|nr:DJ-1/PfpI family protein [Chitinophagaceae bacterium]